MTATEGAETLVREGASPGAVVRMQLALPVTLVTAGAVVGLASAQGGYFPTSWGLSATLLLWVTGLWIVISGRTDAGRIDARPRKVCSSSSAPCWCSPASRR
ncbi:MAG: hypothetical protein E6G28_07745 [Actinobacteria bacterium]|nr:MAG: hypothetical protein E6G28_07745 [Actinomycetota bacterium]